jgi:enoyl-CoA hydratase/carnithine racemase
LEGIILSDLILRDQSDHVLRLTIDRPEKKNAINSPMYETLVEELNRAERDDAVRVVVFRGTDGNLTSGNDLSEFQEAPENFDETVPAFRFVKSLAFFPKPIVTQVEGYAVGIGATMLLHSDIVYSEPGAQIRFPFVDLGVVPEAGSSLLLPMMAGHQKAAEIIYKADFLSPEEGYEIGFVNDVLPADELQERVRDEAETLAGKPPEALRETKRLLRANYREQLEDTIDEEARIFHERLNSEEAMECMAAMIEDRDPDFS